ncbi:MAG: UDP-2,3-diacylglucosamine diphosphatase LpxI [Candidatus Sumerlaeia bacterium]|nr:UDP-2,3-diacylglucosamine diphosphatase LpxI [Candidatus Sumerlaeia bacterium]
MTTSAAPMPFFPMPKTIGLIAGQGDFPVLLAQGAKGAGVELVAFGVKGLASEEVARYASAVYSLKLTELTRLFELCRQHGVKHLIMAGRIPHRVLLQQISFDPRVLSVLKNLKDKKADSLLLAATQEIEKEGIQVMDSTLFLKSCMPEAGFLTELGRPHEDILKDIKFGYPIAKEIAKLDVGQAIAVKNQIVVAVEGIEGTDELILRSKELAGEGVVFVKVSKPRQDMRFDVPVVGKRTFENLRQVGAAALCVSAGKTIFLDRDYSLELANQNSIFVYAWDDEVGPEF